MPYANDLQAKPALSHLMESDPERKDLYAWRLRKLAEVDRLRRGPF